MAVKLKYYRRASGGNMPDDSGYIYEAVPEAAGNYSIGEELQAEQWMKEAKAAKVLDTSGKPTGKTYYDTTKQQFPDLDVGFSNYITNPQTGNIQQKSSYDESQRLASDPNMINVGTATAPLYIPKGTPAADMGALPINKQQYEEQPQAVQAASTAKEPIKITEIYTNEKGETMEVVKNADKAALAKLGWKPQVKQTTDVIDMGKIDTQAPATAKSAEMNKWSAKVNEIYKNNPNAIANKEFVDAVSRAAKGVLATKEETQQYGVDKNNPYALVGLSVRDVMGRFGLLGETGDMGVIDTAKEGKTKEQTIKDLQAKTEAGGVLTDIDKENWNYATGDAPLPAKIAPADTAQAGTGTTGTGNYLDDLSSMVNDYVSNKNIAREEAKDAEGIDEKTLAVSTAQKTADNTLTLIETKKSQLEATAILDEESKIALQNKLKGQTIPMATINRQLLSGLEDMDQAQRLERLYDTYELNTNINLYNSQLRNVQLLQGQYEKAMENVKENVDDWTEMQNLKLQVLEERGVLEKEARARAEKEIDYQRDLGIKGYVWVENIDTYNKLVKDMGVNAQNFSSFFFKDVDGKIYLKPEAEKEYDTKFETAGGRNLMITYDKQGNIVKQTDLGGAYKGTTGGGGTSTTTEKQATSDMMNKLKTVTGSDGFISPDDYLKARNAWIAEGFNPTTFDSQFKGFQNPNNPNYVTDKTSSSRIQF